MMQRRPVRQLAFLAVVLLFWLTLQLTLPERASPQVRVLETPMGADRQVNGTKWVEPPLHTSGRYILDANGERIKLVSVSWYGASDVIFVPMGLDQQHRTEIARTIREMGFNSVRFPYSDQMVLDNPVIDPVYLRANLDLLDGHETEGSDGHETGPRAMQVYQACVEAMTDAGLAVIINNHITNAHWCDGMNLCDASWKNDHLWPFCTIQQTTASWIENWKTLMKPFVDNPLVIGVDLRNEPRGLWGMMTWRKIVAAAEEAGNALLELQPNWLIFVEGTGSANDCSGARKHPVQLSIPDRVVYSPHVYSWSGWGSLIPFGKRSYRSFVPAMERNWAYLLRENIAPVWLGEFGAAIEMDNKDYNYWANLMRYLDETDVDWGYWALPAHRPGSSEYDNSSYGLLRNDYSTRIEDIRMNDMRRLMGSKV